jgi:rod shape-determining protein MreC
VDLVEARRAEGELRRELGAARRRVALLEAVEVENAHLRALLDLEARNPAHDLEAARVVGAGLDPGVSVLRIDEGALDGLERGFPVLSGAGLVGRVLDVGWTTAEVQLVADPRVSVPAQILRTGARGRLRGRGDGLDFGLVLSEVLRSDDVRPGDRVVTSGLGGIYPPGIPIGRVTRLFTKEGVPHRFADVAPFVDFSRLEAVEVILEAAPGRPLVTPEPLLPPSLRAAPDAGPRAPPSSPWPPDAPDAGGRD